MNRLGRWLTLGTRNHVGRDEALVIAHEACEDRGLPWREPIKVYRHYGDWAVWTYANHRGGNVRVIVDGATGEVKRMAGPTPR